MKTTGYLDGGDPLMGTASLVGGVEVFSPSLVKNNFLETVSKIQHLRQQALFTYNIYETPRSFSLKKYCRIKSFDGCLAFLRQTVV